MKIVKFGSRTCGPCKVQHDRMQGCKYPFEEIDVEEQEDVIEKYGIRGIPVTAILDDDGNLLHKWTGLVDLKVIEDKFEELNK